MARAKVNKDGDKVVLKMSFEEAAAVYALLCRVGDETSVAVNEASMHCFDVMNEVSSELKAQGLWPGAFDAFAGELQPLVTREEHHLDACTGRIEHDCACPVHGDT